MRYLILLACVLAPVYAYVDYFAERYTIGFNQATANCLKTSLFIVDHFDKDVRAGDLVAFRMNKDNLYFEKGMQWIKRVAAEPNSTVEVSRDQLVVNGEHSIPLNMSSVMFTIGKDFPETAYEDFTGLKETASDEWFLIGETIYSYDSRFWGNIKTDDIIGKAYAIW